MSGKMDTGRMVAMRKRKKLHFRTSLKGFLKLVRLPNLLILLLTQYFVRVFIIGPTYDWRAYILDPYFFMLCLSTLLVAAAGYIINDYYDVKIDTVNKPRRVIIGRIFRRRIALITHLGLNFFSLLFGLILGWKILMVIVLSGFLLWWYSNNLKRLPLIGNICVALLTASSILIISLYIPKNQELVLMYATFAFFISLVREVIKDMEDVKGDSIFGCKTLPILWGIRKTKQFLFLVIIVFLLSISYFIKDFPNSTILAFLILILPPVMYMAIKLQFADTTKDFENLSLISKLIMLAGVVSMVFI